MKNGLKISSNLKYEAGKGIAITVDLPDEDDLRSFYLAFRFFYLQKEPANFLRITNIIHRVADDALARQNIDNLKRLWSGALFQEMMHIAVNDTEVTPSQLLDLWFNAYYFHSDEYKSIRLSEINEVLTNDLSRFFLANAVIEATKAVLKLYDSIRGLANLCTKSNFDT
ncbi:MAG: hypothetical protein HY807_03925 [Nitrospirae bacterium]|nr:hypothetical protein [Nitrospirota bacterium]